MSSFKKTAPHSKDAEAAKKAALDIDELRSPGGEEVLALLNKQERLSGASVLPSR